MPESITAVYENGVFRPLSAVSFKDGETVQINVVRDVSPEALKDDREKAIKLMDLRKLMGLPTKHFKLDAAAEQKRRELFEKLKGRPGTPVSEIVIEDRGPW
jgi:predicted DNA-binding antitoxin AbrB/MazE fold protein